jgi:hypothetical protein
MPNVDKNKLKDKQETFIGLQLNILFCELFQLNHPLSANFFTNILYEFHTCPILAQHFMNFWASLNYTMEYKLTSYETCLHCCVKLFMFCSCSASRHSQWTWKKRISYIHQAWTQESLCYGVDVWRCYCCVTLPTCTLYSSSDII